MVLLAAACVGDVPPPPPPPAPAPTATASDTPTPDPVAAPCRGRQLKGDRLIRVYYERAHPEYARLRTDVECFNSHGEAQGAGYRRAPVPTAPATPAAVVRPRLRGDSTFGATAAG